MFRKQWRRLQDSGEKLARYITPNAKWLRGIDGALPDEKRRISVLRFIANGGAGGVESFDEIADGPFVHAGNAVDPVSAADERQHGYERAGREAGISHEDIRFGSRELACSPHDEVSAFGLNRDAQLGQGFSHHLGIVGIEEVGEACFAFGERCQKQGSD